MQVAGRYVTSPGPQVRSTMQKFHLDEILHTLFPLQSADVENDRIDRERFDGLRGGGGQLDDVHAIEDAGEVVVGGLDRRGDHHHAVAPFDAGTSQHVVSTHLEVGIHPTVADGEPLPGISTAMPC